MRKLFAILVLFLALGIGSMQCLECAGASLPVTESVSWWTIFYERPNPNRLPVKVNFRLAKGLHYSLER
ncbi:hypothetical protein KE530_02785 [Clostridiaceae bacterium Marseille-Q4145]|nr:hypothetical protein [Clostridiaceae bacterium Marseille-Q4145]